MELRGSCVRGARSIWCSNARSCLWARGEGVQFDRVHSIVLTGLRDRRWDARSLVKCRERRARIPNSITWTPHLDAIAWDAARGVDRVDAAHRVPPPARSAVPSPAAAKSISCSPVYWQQPVGGRHHAGALSSHPCVGGLGLARSANPKPPTMRPTGATPDPPVEIPCAHASRPGGHPAGLAESRQTIACPRPHGATVVRTNRGSAAAGTSAQNAAPPPAAANTAHSFGPPEYRWRSAASVALRGVGRSARRNRSARQDGAPRRRSIRPLEAVGSTRWRSAASVDRPGGTGPLAPRPATCHRETRCLRRRRKAEADRSGPPSRSLGSRRIRRVDKEPKTPSQIRPSSLRQRLAKHATKRPWSITRPGSPVRAELAPLLSQTSERPLPVL